MNIPTKFSFNRPYMVLEKKSKMSTFFYGQWPTQSDDNSSHRPCWAKFATIL